MLKNRVNFTKNMESKIRYVPLENKNINNLDQKNFLSDDGEKLVNAKLNRVNYQKISKTIAEKNSNCNKFTATDDRNNDQKVLTPVYGYDYTRNLKVELPDSYGCFGQSSFQKLEQYRQSQFYMSRENNYYVTCSKDDSIDKKRAAI